MWCTPVAAKIEPATEDWFVGERHDSGDKVTVDSTDM